jgi:hypothetical protein
MRFPSLITGLLTAVVLFAPEMIRAETLLIRNETDVPLTVQAACVIDGMVRPQRPVLLQPGGVTRVSLPGNKLVNVYDSRLPNRSLFQGTVEASKQDQAFAIVADGPSGKVKLEPARMPGGAPPGVGGPGMPGPRPGPGPGTPPPGGSGKPKR